MPSVSLDHKNPHEWRRATFRRTEITDKTVADLAELNGLAMLDLAGRVGADEPASESHEAVAERREHSLAEGTVELLLEHVGG